MAEQNALQPGAIFGRDFRIVRALRAGGMGAVYVVDQLSTGKQRALKVIAPEFAENPAARERFVLEARAGSRIESDHVVEVVTAGIDADTGAPYLVMELLRGEELADALTRLGPLPLGDVAEVLTQVGHGLEQAHAQGLVHRDIKPENIFLAVSRRKDATFTAKILDFGIAKLAAANVKTGTQPLGTPLYMAPEQTKRTGKIAPTTDVWALGLLAFMMLTGRDFWLSVTDGTLTTLMGEVCMDEIPPATTRAREMGVAKYLPEGFDAWFARCVNRDQEARFPEAGAAVRAFMELVPPGAPRGTLVVQAPAITGSSIDMASPLTTDVPISGSSIQVRAVSGAPPATAQAALARTEAASGPSAAAPRKSPTLFIVLALAAIAGGAFAFFMMRDKPVPPEATPGATQSPSATPTASGSASSAPAVAGCPAGMLPIAGGKMFMGARDLTESAKPPHEVTVASFCMDRTEVTTAAYQACVATGECERPLDKVSWPKITEDKTRRYSPFCNGSNKERGEHPINCVAWPMADMYCRKKGARLPTEAEWEYAARGSSQRKFPWGDDEPTEKHLNACGAECKAWGAANGEERTPMYAGDDGFAATAPVGSFPAGGSAHGVMDMAGNVWEWTADWYAEYGAEPQVNPKGPATGTQRVARGGDFFSSSADWARPAYRWKTDPDTYNHAIGFRCAADVK